MTLNACEGKKTFENPTGNASHAAPVACDSSPKARIKLTEGK